MKISEIMIHLQETLKDYGDLDVKMNIYDEDAEETLEADVKNIETEHRITTSRESKNGNILVLNSNE